MNKAQEIFDQVIYISPSTIPSRSANSVHVLNQCNALADHCSKVIAFCASIDNLRGKNAIHDFYGIAIKSDFEIKQLHVKSNKALQLKIALFSMFYILMKRQKNDLVISRNFYISVFLTMLGIRHIYETHGPESNKLKQTLQNFVMRNNKVVCISNQLAKILTAQCSANLDMKVLHDAASSFQVVDMDKYLVKNKRFKVGYFGHLYAGRGIEIIEQLARRFSNIDFYIVGGDETSIAKLRKQVKNQNLKIIGYVRNNEARSLMLLMDALLMPYQNKVSIGLPKSDTSKWMSPLKLFEYLSSKKPIISSDLTVLREVLKNGHNAMLVKANDIDEWSEALHSLYSDKSLRVKLAKNAYQRYRQHHTWSQRAQQIIEFAKKDHEIKRSC